MKKRILFFLLFIGITSVGYAQGGGSSVSSYFELIEMFQTEQAEIWKTRAFVMGQILFWPLVTMQFAYYGIGMMSGWWSVPNKSSLGRKAIIMGVFLILLFSFYQLEHIVYGIRDLALYITGRPGDINEMGLIAEGLDIILEALSLWDGDDQPWYQLLFGNIVGLFTHGFIWLIGFFGILIGYTVMALQYAFITIEIFIAISVSPILIAFGASEKTRGMAEGYIEYLFELGFKAFFFYMVFGLCKALLDNLAQTFDTELLDELADKGLIGILNYYFEPFLEIGFVCILTVALLAKLPSRLASKVTAKLNINFDKIIPKG